MGALTLNYILLAAASSLCFAITNIIDKHMVSRWVKKPLTFTVVINLLETVWMLALILPWRGFHLLPLPLLLMSLGLGGFFTLYIWPYVKALSIEEASRVIPIFQLSPIFVFFLSMFFIHESLTSKLLVGFVLLIVGGFLISLKSIRGIFKLSTAFYFMLLASLMWAVIMVSQKYLFGLADFFDVFVWSRIGALMVALAILLSSSVRRDLFSILRKAPVRVKSVLIANEGVAVAAFFLGGLALTLGPASIVSALNGLQPLFVLAIAIILSLWLPSFLKEDLAKTNILLKIAAILIIFAGLWLVY
ncbi:MAG: DMT family transporter [Candidatus Woesearchaeota archaeon]